MTRIVLDHIKNIGLDTTDPPLSNTHALWDLRAGLHFLACVVRTEEIRLSKELPETPVFAAGSSIDPNGIIACCFNWFSISIVSYLRLVGLIDVMSQQGWKSQDIRGSEGNRRRIRSHCVEYVKDIVPDILQWRNKIAAHFAVTDPTAEDNLGTLQYCVINPISYSRPYLKAGDLTWTIGTEESQLPAWALTQKYEELEKRLWPGVKLQRI